MAHSLLIQSLILKTVHAISGLQRKWGTTPSFIKLILLHPLSIYSVAEGGNANPAAVPLRTLIFAALGATASHCCIARVGFVYLFLFFSCSVFVVLDTSAV